MPNTAAKEGAQMQKLISLLPIENIVLETDSPALSFTPGGFNEPKNLEISAQIISDIRKIPINEVKAITTANAIRLFPKLKTLLRI